MHGESVGVSVSWLQLFLDRVTLMNDRKLKMTKPRWRGSVGLHNIPTHTFCVFVRRGPAAGTR